MDIKFVHINYSGITLQSKGVFFLGNLLNHTTLILALSGCVILRFTRMFSKTNIKASKSASTRDCCCKKCECQKTSNVKFYFWTLKYVNIIILAIHVQSKGVFFPWKSLKTFHSHSFSFWLCHIMIYKNIFVDQY